MSVPSTCSIFPDFSTVRPFAAEAETAPDAVLETVLRQLDESYAMHGWDQPMQLFALTPSSALPPGLRKRVTRELGYCPAAGTLLAFEVDVPGEGQPYHLLAARRLPSWVEGVLLVTEAWAYPDGVDRSIALVPPYEHPQRVECRFSTLVTRDGAVLTRITRRNGHSSETTDGYGRQTTGQLMDALLRLIGSPTPPSYFHPIHLIVARMMVGLIGWAVATKHAPRTPAIRTLAHGLLGAGRHDLDEIPIPIDVTGSIPLHADSMDQYLASATSAESKLHVWMVAFFDSNDCSSSEPEPLLETEWARVGPTWAEMALSRPELSWMDAGMYARHALARSVGSATFDELLASIAVAFGDCEAEMLSRTLTSVGYAPWPQSDLPSPTTPTAA